jgi:hypothetical protein
MQRIQALRAENQASWKAADDQGFACAREDDVAACRFAMWTMKSHSSPYAMMTPTCIICPTTNTTSFVSYTSKWRLQATSRADQGVEILLHLMQVGTCVTVGMQHIEKGCMQQNNIGSVRLLCKLYFYIHTDIMRAPTLCELPIKTKRPCQRHSGRRKHSRRKHWL